MAFLIGLFMSAAGGVTLLRLIWLHFGSTGLWFVGAYLLLTTGNSLIEHSTGGKP